MLKCSTVLDELLVDGLDNIKIALTSFVCPLHMCGSINANTGRMIGMYKCYSKSSIVTEGTPPPSKERGGANLVVMTKLSQRTQSVAVHLIAGIASNQLLYFPSKQR